MAVIQRPALDLLVQTMDQLPCRPTTRPADGLPDLLQERPHVPAGRFHQYLAAVMPPDRLSQKIEAVVDMRDLGFLVGEFETPLSKELLHERLDSMFQKEP